MKVPGETGLHKYVQSKCSNVLVFNYNFINIIACNYRLAVTSQQVFNNFEYMHDINTFLMHSFIYYLITVVFFSTHNQYKIIFQKEIVIYLPLK